MTPIECAKAQLDITTLWERRAWPGTPGRSCRVPYRPEDKRPSGSVFADGQLFHDFKEGRTMDAIDLLAEVEGLERDHAARAFLAIAGINSRQPPGNPRANPQPTQRRQPPATRPLPKLPPLDRPTATECAIIAGTRGLRPEACHLAADRGLLFTADYHGTRVWTVTDRCRRNAQHRRLDGEPFTTKAGPVKALTAKGAWAAWPIGLSEAALADTIAIVEGGADLLACHQLLIGENAVETVAPVAILGASHQIPDKALDAFRDKAALLIPHDDSAGLLAACRWEAQLRAAGARVVAYDLSGLKRRDGEPVGDLNDLLLMAADERAEIGTIFVR